MLLIYVAAAAFLSIHVKCDSHDEITDCIPRLADRCFSDMSKYIEYQLNTPGATLYNVTDFCASASDCLDCAKDIIDNDCDVYDGKDNFDLWLNAMQSVVHYLCYDSSESLQEFLQQSLSDKRCWNLTEFMACVEEKSHVTHVVDMLQVTIDINECNWLLIAFSTCNVDATKRSDCTITQKTVNELIHIFLQETKCANICSGAKSTKLVSSLVLIFSYLSQYILFR